MVLSHTGFVAKPNIVVSPHSVISYVAGLRRSNGLNVVYTHASFGYVTAVSLEVSVVN